VGDDLTARLHLANDHPLPGEYRPEERSAPIRLPQNKIQTPIFGVAAMAGRIFGLTPLQLKNTLGLVGNSEGFGGGIADGAPTFKIGQGTMARGGIISALMARKGWTGAIDPFFDPGAGLFSNRLDHPEMLTKDLGGKFYVEEVFKLYPGGWPTQAPAAAAIEISNKYHLKTDEIEEVILRTSPGISTATHYARPYKVGVYPTGDALFSYKYAVANGLVRGTARNKDYTEEAVRDPEVQTLIKKVKLALAELSASEGVELEVKMKDGSRFNQRVARAHGEPSSPLSQNTLISKFMEQVNFTQIISQKRAEKLIELIQNLEDVDDVSKILKFSVKG
jgi:2-methylcitrate dehydratase PrpD